MKIDTVTKVVLQTIEAAGYAVTMTETEVSATDSKTCERLILPRDNVDRLYKAAAGLARRRRSRT